MLNLFLLFFKLFPFDYQKLESRIYFLLKNKPNKISEIKFIRNLNGRNLTCNIITCNECVIPSIY